jgi:hypothetical protein
MTTAEWLQNVVLPEVLPRRIYDALLCKVFGLDKYGPDFRSTGLHCLGGILATLAGIVGEIVGKKPYMSPSGLKQVLWAVWAQFAAFALLLVEKVYCNLSRTSLLLCAAADIAA